MDLLPETLHTAMLEILHQTDARKRRNSIGSALPYLAKVGRYVSQKSLYMIPFKCFTYLKFSRSSFFPSIHS